MKRVAAAAVVLALVLMAVLHVVALSRLVQRTALDIDESEFLQAAVHIARGERIYVDFAEHHSPITFAVLSWLAPHDLNDRGQLRGWVIRTRILCGLLGTIALAAAAFLVWRATRRLDAVVIFTGAILAAPLLWDRAFADARAEPPALAILFLGLVLILATNRIEAGGIGVGLIALSVLMNPKWPLVSFAAGIFFLISAARGGRRVFLRGIAIAIASTAAAVGILAALTDLRRYYDFVFAFNGYLFQWWLVHGRTINVSAAPLLYCPAIFRPQYVLPAALIVAAAAVFRRDAFRDVRVVDATLAILIASAIEIRFIYPWPLLWVQYYIVWGMAAAAIYAYLPPAILAIVERFAPRAVPVARAVPVVFVVLALINAPSLLPMAEARDPRAIVDAAIAAKLRPGDTVFLGALRHPLGARDASYYWFGFDDFVPAAIDFAKTPRGRAILPPIGEEDLPPCRLERGLEPHLRFIGGDSLERLPVVSGCVDRLRARGVITTTTTVGVFLVRRKGELQ